MNRPDFPMTIDSTMRASFVGCPFKFMEEYMLHWKPKYPSIDLHAGKCFAAGLETSRKAFWEQGIDNADECIALGAKRIMMDWGDFQEPEGHVKSLDRIIGALDEYFRHYGFATDHIQPFKPNGKPAIEFSFALPIPGTAHPVTGEPIIYTGRNDLIGTFNNQLFIEDDKTTKQLGPTWPKQWTLRGQITGYCWAARSFGYPVAGAIIRGISILKNGYGHAESLQYRDDWMVDRWLIQLQHDVKRMIECWESDFWDQVFDGHCTMYSGCMYMDSCARPNPSQNIAECGDFERRVWNPLEMEEIAWEDFNK